MLLPINTFAIMETKTLSACCMRMPYAEAVPLFFTEFVQEMHQKGIILTPITSIPGEYDISFLVCCPTTSRLPESLVESKRQCETAMKARMHVLVVLECNIRTTSTNFTVNENGWVTMYLTHYRTLLKGNIQYNNKSFDMFSTYVKTHM